MSSWSRYKRSEARRRYDQSPRGVEAAFRKRHTAHCIESQRRYDESGRGRDRHRLASSLYRERHPEKHRLFQARYHQNHKDDPVYKERKRAEQWRRRAARRLEGFSQRGYILTFQ